jgi:hypothetical protein
MLRKKWLFAIACALFFTQVSSATAEPVRSIRFDPGYLYGFPWTKGATTTAIINRLLKLWQRYRIKRVYILVNSPAYGAYFPTNILYQKTEGTLGGKDFLKRLIHSLKAKGLEPYAWFYVMRSKDAWNSMPTWRGSCPPPAPEGIDYLLDLGNRQSRNWFSLLVLETLLRFPELSGADLAEPVEHLGCRTSEATPPSGNHLTSYLRELSALIAQIGRKTTITLNLPINQGGKIWSATLLQQTFGLDLQSIAAIPAEAIYAELPYSSNFRVSIDDFISRLPKSAKAGVHIELGGTDINSPTLRPEQLTQITKVISRRGVSSHLAGIDFYDTRLAFLLQAVP